MKKAKKAGDRIVECFSWTLIVHPKINTKCKHGSGDCEVCGTSNITDRVHTTEGGLGVVARLRKKRR